MKAKTIMKISSKDNPLIKYLTELNQSKKLRDECNEFIVEGYNLVEEASSQGLLKKVYTVKEDPKYPDAIIITFDILKKITNTVTPEGIIGVCNKNNKKEYKNNILFLDNVQDPGNIGTLLRSCCAFGFDTIVLDNCCDIYNPKVIRSSEGAIFKLSFVNDTIIDLKNKGYKIIATSMNGISIDKFDYKSIDKYVLVLGNEGHGVRQEILDICDYNLTIPMKNIESLNVGVAGSIIMYEFKK